MAETPALFRAEYYCKEVLFTEAQVKEKLAQLAARIAEACEGREMVIIGILKGSFMFLADLVKLLYMHDVHPTVDFMACSSYGSSTTSSGTVRIDRDVTMPLEGKWVLLVDDILDSGRTISFAREHLQEKGAETVRTCVFLDKPGRRVVPISPDYCGFEVPDRFIVGYGLDWNNRFRDLPYVALLDESKLPDQ